MNSSKRVYLTVAEALREAKPQLASSIAMRGQWEADCRMVAIAFERMSPTFDRQRFLRDCASAPPAIPPPSPTLVQAILVHAKRFGAKATASLICAAGAPANASNLARVPPANRAALEAQLLADLARQDDGP